MHLEYVGHKPVISHSGVDFSIGKEDKYVYIEAAAQMLDFLSKLDNTIKSIINPSKLLDEQEVLSILHKNRPGFNLFFKERISAYEKKLENEILEVNKLISLNKIKKEVLLNNLNFMKDYRLQRVTNMLVYDELINGCIDIIEKPGVVSIEKPFSLTFVHVATSFESSLARINRAVVAKVEVKLDKEQPYTHLTIHGFESA